MSKQQQQGNYEESPVAEPDISDEVDVPSDSADQKFSPNSMLVYLIVVIFVAEVIVMGLLHTVVDLPPVTEALIDSTALLLLVFPVLYVALFRPMNRTIDQLQTQKEAMKRYKRTIDQTETQRNNLEVLNQVLRHDIRNDVQLVSAYSELLEPHVEDEEGEQYLQTIDEFAGNAITLTETAGELADVMLRPQEENDLIPLGDVVEQEVAEVREANAHAEIRFDGPLPEAKVRANSLLNSVFRNLLTNAIRHNDKNEPKVALSAEKRNGTIRVRVADNGPGVPDPQKKEIFGRGEKGLESGGTGIGLYLVDTLVDSYTGDVWIEDNEPEGAVFVVELPVIE